jgi:Zn-dependent protease
MDMLDFFVKLSVFFVPLLFSLCFHEYAHGWVAKMKGDRTAEMMGRLTMNPIPHMDMIGTVVLPVLAILFNSPIFFGWAKPVPVNSRNLKNPKSDMFWVALAGPLSNILLAIVGALVLVLSVLFISTTGYFNGVKMLLQQFILTNLFLAVFNMIPLNPLDGGKVLARFLPYKINRTLEDYEQYTSMILLFLVLFGALKFLAVPVRWMYDLLVSGAVGILA